MELLTQAHRDHFDEYGYMVIEDAVPVDLCAAVVDAIFAFLEMDPDDPGSWYRAPHKPGAGMVEMYQHQAMWNVYQHPPIHRIYSQVYGTERIWVHPDRVNMKPPRHPDHPEWDHKGMYHWDADTSKLPVSFGTQGVLFLTDTADDQGSFVCWPGAHKSLIDPEDPWVRALIHRSAETLDWLVLEQGAQVTALLPDPDAGATPRLHQLQIDGLGPVAKLVSGLQDERQQLVIAQEVQLGEAGKVLPTLFYAMYMNTFLYFLKEIINVH